VDEKKIRDIHRWMWGEIPNALVSEKRNGFQVKS
jgi:hypothetical protein